MTNLDSSEMMKNEILASALKNKSISPSANFKKQLKSEVLADFADRYIPRTDILPEPRSFNITAHFRRIFTFGVVPAAFAFLLIFGISFLTNSSEEISSPTERAPLLAANDFAAVETFDESLTSDWLEEDMYYEEDEEDLLYFAMMDDFDDYMVAYEEIAFANDESLNW